MVPNSDMTRTEISGAFARSTSRPPVTAVTANGNPAHRDRHVLGHVHVDVAQGDEHGQRCSPALDLGLTQVEVDVAEGTTGDRPAPEPQPSALDHVGDQRAGEAGGATPRPPYRQLLGRRQSGANPVEISLTDGCVRLVHSLGELLEGEPPGEQVVLQPRHRLLPIGVGDPLVHARHGPRGAATVTGA
jgi:hypothetical protein